MILAKVARWLAEVAPIVSLNLRRALATLGCLPVSTLQLIKGVVEMAKKRTRRAAFEYFGMKQCNVRWSCSAKSADGEIVVVTLWQDKFENRDGRRVYERLGFDHGAPGTLPRERELMENLVWAHEQCGGRFSVIVAIAKDISAHPRAIEDCFPSKMVMKVTHLNPITGAFTAEAERI
jgi:hypothetical protein